MAAEKGDENQKQAGLNLAALVERLKAKGDEDEKIKKKAQEEELERTMRDRLSQFGFQNEQIETLMVPDEQTDSQEGTTSITPQSTYAKIATKHLDIETLHHYDIPYETDAVRFQSLIYLTSMCQ
jgi:hypothetical protein